MRETLTPHERAWRRSQNIVGSRLLPASRATEHLLDAALTVFIDTCFPDVKQTGFADALLARGFDDEALESGHILSNVLGLEEQWQLAHRNPVMFAATLQTLTAFVQKPMYHPSETEVELEFMDPVHTERRD